MFAWSRGNLGTTPPCFRHSPVMKVPEKEEVVSGPTSILKVYSSDSVGRVKQKYCCLANSYLSGTPELLLKQSACSTLERCHDIHDPWRTRDDFCHACGADGTRYSSGRESDPYQVHFRD